MPQISSAGLRPYRTGFPVEGSRYLRSAGAVDAFTDGAERLIDVGEVNGRMFLKDVSGAARLGSPIPPRR